MKPGGTISLSFERTSKWSRCFKTDGIECIDDDILGISYDGGHPAIQKRVEGGTVYHLVKYHIRQLITVVRPGGFEAAPTEDPYLLRVIALRFGAAFDFIAIRFVIPVVAAFAFVRYQFAE